MTSTAHTASPIVIANAFVAGRRAEGPVDVTVVGRTIETITPAGALPPPRRAMVIDGDGATITAGLTDGHSHWMWGANMLDWVDLTGLRTLPAVRQALAARRAEIGPGPWLLARGAEYTAFLAHGGPHRRLIDDAVGDGPAYLMFFDLHGALANTNAVSISRLAHADPPIAGTVAVDADGPTGFLIEFEAMRLVEDHTPQNSPDQLQRLARQTLRMMSQYGYTNAHMMNGRLRELDLIRDLDEADQLPVDLEVCWDLTPELDAHDALAALGRLGQHGEHWRLSGVKFWLDGVIDSGSAWLCHADHHGGNAQPLWMPPERYRELAIAYASAGFRIATHAIGDAAVTYALETYQRCSRAARHRIEHLEITNDRNLELLTGHDNVAASVQPPAMAYVSALRDDTWSDRVPADQWHRAWALRDIASTGTRVVMGTDWPVLPLDPRLAFHWATKRRPVGADIDQVIGSADQALTATEVLDGFTVDAAWAVGRSDTGRLHPGNSADIALWDRDLLHVGSPDVLDTTCLATIAQGRIVHDIITGRTSP